MKKRTFLFGLNRLEGLLWLCSVTVIAVSFFISRNTAWLYLVASLIGALALILVSKGHVLGQILTVVFSVLYGIISYSYAYYGEMITYLGMTLPIAAASVVTWLCHPFAGKRNEVEVKRLSVREHMIVWTVGLTVTLGAWFLLKGLKTENLFISTVSVFTSFLAVVYSMRRSRFYALAYAANDVVLILLWVLAALENAEYSCMVLCFLAFLVNDLYGYVNWRRMERAQRRAKEGKQT